MAASNVEENNDTIRGKKRKNPQEWARSKIKIAKTRGECHKNHVNKTVPARETGSDCRFVAVNVGLL